MVESLHNPADTTLQPNWFVVSQYQSGSSTHSVGALLGTPDGVIDGTIVT